MGKTKIGMYRHSATYKRLIGSADWRRVRAQQLAEHPFCELCAKKGVYYQTGATEVHHIMPVDSARTEEEAERLAYGTSNLMSLCHKCHSDLHKAEHSHSRKSHQKRAEEELARWIEGVTKSNNGAGAI